MGSKGTTKVKDVTVSVASLNCQLCPIAHNPNLWKGDLKGSIVNSPHVQFLRTYQEKGKSIFSRLKETDYYKMYKYWDEIGYGLGGRTDKYINKKANSLLSLFNNIRKNGYDKRSKIQILKTPLWVSRGFDGGEHLEGFEIFHGHHRCSCAIVLGIKKIKAHICRDSEPDSMKWVQKIDRVKNDR